MGKELLRADARRTGRKGQPLPPGPRLLARGPDFVSALEDASRKIDDPIDKLRYIRGSLARYQQAERYVEAVPLSPLRRLLAGFLNVEAVRHLLRADSFGGGAAAAPAARSAGLAGLTLATLLAAGAAALATAGYYLTRTTASASDIGRVLPPVAEELPVLPAAMTPAKVWLVEKGAAWEQYSNGLRIDTSFAITGEPRRYRAFRLATGMGGEVYDKPIGIMFHTSESDVWPLEEGFNENLRTSSNQLLKYLQRNRVYHYLIDRFGRVFRVVAEDAKANHAGNSVWTRGEDVLLSLNHSFLGLSFETRWEGGRALPITQAQLAAGRNLTDLLRRRWDITPDMCVGHGLASVNAKKHLIGHHLDWARGFPFEAFGLPNQYTRPAPTVALFGFGYDERFVNVLGEPWPGVREAESLLSAEAAARGKTVEEIRRERQDLYDRWLSEQTRDLEASARAERAGATSPRSPSSGG